MTITIELKNAPKNGAELAREIRRFADSAKRFAGIYAEYVDIDGDNTAVVVGENVIANRITAKQ